MDTSNYSVIPASGGNDGIDRSAQMQTNTHTLLKQLSGKYIWWKTPDEAVAMPERVIAQIMNIGDYADVLLVTEQVGDDTLRNVLMNAEIGQFSDRSWTYWHYRLGLAKLDEVPALPTRSLL